jgi:anti-sigma B factor antagonist
VTATLDPPEGDLVALAVSTNGSAARVSASGEIDSSTAPQLRERLDEVLDSGVSEVVVDLGGVTFLDSAGLCVLAAAHRRAADQDARLRVLASHRAVIRPLEITGLYDLLRVERP